MLGQVLLDGVDYVVLLVYLCSISLLESSKRFSSFRRVFFILSATILWLFIGCRWETGTDWWTYKELFDTIELNWSFLINIYHFDIGYVFFNALVRLFTDNYSVFLIINSGITIFLLSKLILKVSRYPNLSLTFFYTNFMIAQFMGSNRRMMAMVFVLYFFYGLFYVRKLFCIANISFAFLFHRSALVNLIACFIPKNIFTFKQTISIILFSFVIGIIQLPARIIEITGNLLSMIFNNPIVEKMVFYSENGDEHLVYGTGNMVLSTILAVGKRSILLMIYMYIVKTNKIDKLTQFLYNIYVIGFAGYLLFTGSFFQMLTAYFTIVEILLLGRMYYYLNKRLKLIFCFLLFFYGYLQICNALAAYPELYLPYKSFFYNV